MNDLLIFIIGVLVTALTLFGVFFTKQEFEKDRKLNRDDYNEKHHL